MDDGSRWWWPCPLAHPYSANPQKHASYLDLFTNPSQQLTGFALATSQAAGCHTRFQTEGGFNTLEAASCTTAVVATQTLLWVDTSYNLSPQLTLSAELSYIPWHWLWRLLHFTLCILHAAQPPGHQFDHIDNNGARHEPVQNSCMSLCRTKVHTILSFVITSLPKSQVQANFEARH